MIKHLFHLMAWACLVLGVAIEARLMETPVEETVTDFELAEEGLSVVLTNALEDARELVEYLTKQKDGLQREWVLVNNAGLIVEAANINTEADEVSEMQFRAMRVLGLLEATRDREAGQVT